MPCTIHHSQGDLEIPDSALRTITPLSTLISGYGQELKIQADILPTILHHDMLSPQRLSPGAGPRPHPPADYRGFLLALDASRSLPISVIPTPAGMANSHLPGFVLFLKIFTVGDGAACPLVSSRALSRSLTVGSLFA